MTWDRETVAAAFVGTGGAWMLGSAFLHGKTGRWNRKQLAGLAYSGSGFLLSAVAARWLQHTGRMGIAVSLVGTMLALRGMLLLLRERAAQREQTSEAGPATLHEPRTLPRDHARNDSSVSPE